MNVHTCCLIVKHQRAGMPISKNRDDLAEIKQKHNFDIRVKCHGHTDVINVYDTSSYADLLMC